MKKYYNELKRKIEVINKKRIKKKLAFFISNTVNLKIFHFTLLQLEKLKIFIILV